MVYVVYCNKCSSSGKWYVVFTRKKIFTHCRYIIRSSSSNNAFRKLWSDMASIFLPDCNNVKRNVVINV